MTQKICARVDSRLLGKADRLFTGSIEGRIIEVLQNARRAGATEVKITNRDGSITVQDNGSGIDDFQKLLDLGGSGWDEKLEAGEDPAGVGLFSLAPREVRIVSKYKEAVITKDGWTGEPVEVTVSEEFVRGTKLLFTDVKPWDKELVEKHAVFAKIRVVVDGHICHSMPFCGREAVDYSTPGCRIEVTRDVSKYHQNWASSWYHGRVLVNFHGQVVQLDHWPGESRHGLCILVDLNDQTDIRLMLPARTRLVENAALEQLKQAIEIEYYRYFQKQKSHCLYYKEWQRAKEIGIELPEAEPQYLPGLIHDEFEQCVEVAMPSGFSLNDCYLFFRDDFDQECDEANVHLLGALGKFDDTPFVPVTINKGYMGYSWAKLAKVTKVEVQTGKELLTEGMYANDLACFDKITITVQTSDGMKFANDVCMAVNTTEPRGKWKWTSDVVCVTEAAKRQLDNSNIWYHLGGYDIEGDSYDTQLDYVESLINEFWNDLVGPYESLRQEFYTLLNRQPGIYDKWQKIIYTDDGRLEILFKDGKRETVDPPK